MHHLTRETDMLLTQLVDYLLNIALSRTKNLHLNNNDVSLRKILLVDHMRDLLIKFIYYSSLIRLYGLNSKRMDRALYVRCLRCIIYLNRLLKRICCLDCPNNSLSENEFTSRRVRLRLVTNRS